MKNDAMLDQRSSDQQEVMGQFVVETIRDGPFGPQVVARQIRKNLVINDGKEEILRLAVGMTTAIFNQIRIGKCDTTPTSSDTGVVSSVAKGLATVDVTTFDGRTLQLIVSFPSGTTIEVSATSINEMAVEMSGSSRTTALTALNRSLITATDKTTSDKLKITYECHVT